MFKNIFKGFKTTILGLMLFSGVMYATFIEGTLPFIYGGLIAVVLSFILLLMPDNFIALLKDAITFSKEYMNKSVKSSK